MNVVPASMMNQLCYRSWIDVRLLGASGESRLFNISNNGEFPCLQKKRTIQMNFNILWR